MEMVRRANSSKRADRATEIHMIARHHQTAAAISEPRDRLAVFRRQPVTDIHREQPELVKVRAIETREDRIRLT